MKNYPAVFSHFHPFKSIYLIEFMKIIIKFFLNSLSKIILLFMQQIQSLFKFLYSYEKTHS